MDIRAPSFPHDIQQASRRHLGSCALMWSVWLAIALTGQRPSEHSFGHMAWVTALLFNLIVLMVLFGFRLRIWRMAQKMRPLVGENADAIVAWTKNLELLNKQHKLLWVNFHLSKAALLSQIIAAATLVIAVLRGAF